MGPLSSQWKRAERLKGRECFSWKLPSQCSPDNTNTIREFEEFAKLYVIPTECQEEDGPDITQAEAAGADKPHTVDGWEWIQQPCRLN